MPTNAPAATERRRPDEDPIFGHVLVGIDETPESLVAAAQAGALRAPDGRLVLVAVVERYLATHAGLAAADAEDRLLAGTSGDLTRARELVDADDAILTSGRFVERLAAECSARRATLVAVGVRPHRRLTALTFGGHDVEALHDVRCSLLIARPGWGPHRPEKIVVGIDGSPEARAAEGVARSLADRLGCDVLPVVGLGHDVDLAVLRTERDDALLDPGPLSEAVEGASSRGSLIVVGRSAQGGRRWGGDLVERVVYSARCSVLVVTERPEGEVA
jgi:nucleotide-binding universal stress UspA family protein